MSSSSSSSSDWSSSDDPSAGSGRPRDHPLSRRTTTALFVSAVLYPLVITGVLLGIGLFLLFSATVGDERPAMVAGGLFLLVFVCAHFVLRMILHRTALPAPEDTAALLSASVALALAQTAITFFPFDVGAAWAAPIAATFQGGAIACVLFLSRGHAIRWAAMAMLGVMLLRLLLSLGLDSATDRHAAQGHLTDTVTHQAVIHQYGTAALDAPR